VKPRYILADDVKVVLQVAERDDVDWMDLA